MGYDLNRFDDVVDEELICPICSFILEDPVQVVIWIFFIKHGHRKVCLFYKK